VRWFKVKEVNTRWSECFTYHLIAPALHGLGDILGTDQGLAQLLGTTYTGGLPLRAVLSSGPGSVTTHRTRYDTYERGRHRLEAIQKG